jgi:hypothetical protein
MKYTVIWKQAADQLLAQIWLDAVDRAKVTKAAHEIDQSLSVDANEKGESRDKGRRILLVPPLGVTFTVNELDRMVSVAAVWYIKGKSA